jgi:hypothetical protein
MMTPKDLAREVEARLDGPHDDEHTVAVADLAAEAIRFLNYASGSHSPCGLVYPSTVYWIAGNLSWATYRMVQLFEQLGDWLAATDANGLLGTDDGAPTADVTMRARADLREAITYASKLAGQLSKLQSDINRLNGRGPNRKAAEEEAEVPW